MGIINLPDNTFEVTKYTWATRPSYAKTGDLIMITDIGPVDEVFKWTGTRWAPLNGQCLIYSTNTTVSVTGTGDETELGSVTVPGGLMSENGILEASTFWSVPNNANGKVIRIKLGETSDPVTGGTSFLSRTETTILYHQQLMIIRNANSLTAQKSTTEGLGTGFGISTSVVKTGTLDTSTDKKFFLTGDLSVTSDTVILRGWRLMYKE
jgi:hypothetical protein